MRDFYAVGGLDAGFVEYAVERPFCQGGVVLGRYGRYLYVFPGNAEYGFCKIIPRGCSL